MKLFNFCLLSLSSLFAISKAAEQCGPAECYSGDCLTNPLQVEFVFVIDFSGSMVEEIGGVAQGFSTWASSLADKKFQPSFSIVSFAQNELTGRVRLQKTTDRLKFENEIKSYNKNVVSGGYENGLEVMRAILNDLKFNPSYELNANDILYKSILDSNGNEIPGRDPNVKRVMIFMSDEDSDPVRVETTRFPGMPTSRDLLWSSLSASQQAVFTREVYETANAFLAQDMWLYMLVQDAKPSDSFYGMTPRQYGVYKLNSENADFTNYDEAQTLKNIESSTSSTYDGVKTSLQGLLLKAGKTRVRIFDIMQASNPTFIKNFFDSITVDVGRCDKCYDYECVSGKCTTPVDRCDCAGEKYGTKKLDPNQQCCSNFDCAGYCIPENSTPLNVEDACGICMPAGKTSSFCLRDCNNVPYDSRTSSPPNAINDCGECKPANGNINDGCNTDCKGENFIEGQVPNNKVDSCGLCRPTNDPLECKTDCNGVLYYPGDLTKIVSQADRDKLSPVSTIARNGLDGCGICYDCTLASVECQYDASKDIISAAPIGGGLFDNTRDCCNQCLNDPNREKCYDDRLPSNAVPLTPLHFINLPFQGCINQCVVESKVGNPGNRDVCLVCTTNPELNAYPRDCNGDPICDGRTVNEETVSDSKGNVCGRSECFTTVQCPSSTVTICMSKSEAEQSDLKDRLLAEFCPTECPDGQELDSCNQCTPIGQGAVKDECGLCCFSDAPCQAELFCDGKCFKDLNEGQRFNITICNACDCTAGCDGVVGSEKVINCRGECGEPCSCGNGVVDDGEDCDDGEANGSSDSKCSLECTSESESVNVGPIIGGVVGGVAALVLIAAVGGILYYYASKSGLLGKAGNTVDMGASNSNPLYNDSTTVGQNPLYNQS